MKYWPEAVAIINGRKETLFTYTYCESLEKAKQQIDNWKNYYHYDIKSYKIVEEK